MSNRPTPPEIDARSRLVRALKEQMTRLERARSPGGEGGVVSSGCAALDLALPEGGFRRGTLIEWLTGGHGAGGETLAFYTAREACRAGGAMVVVDRARDLYPPAVARLGIELDQLIVVCPGNRADDVWALDQSLRCPAVAAVLAWPEKLDGHTFRRLQLAAEQGGGVGLLMRPERVRSEPSWAEVRLLVEPLSSAAPEARRRLKIDVLRCPGRMCGGSLEVEIDDETFTLDRAPPLARPADPRRAAGA